MITETKQNEKTIIYYYYSSSHAKTSLIIEGMIKGSQSGGKPKMRYVNQLMKNAGITFYKEELKDMADNREIKRKRLL